jgi:hypothetical protein
LVLVIVRLPPDPEMLIPTPAVRLRIPVLVTVTIPPVFGDTKMPDPGRIDEIPPGPAPPALIVPVRLSTWIPAPTISGPYSPLR